MLVTAWTGLIPGGEWGLIGSPLGEECRTSSKFSLPGTRTHGWHRELPHAPTPVETPAGLSLVAASNCGHRLDELSAAASLGLPSGLQGRLPAEEVDEEESLRAVHPLQ